MVNLFYVNLFVSKTILIASAHHVFMLCMSDCVSVCMSVSSSLLHPFFIFLSPSLVS
jgi:hypothetical protein